DGVLVEVDTGLAVEGTKLVVRLEGAVVVRGLAPRHVLRAGDVAGALRLLLRQMRGREQLARELVRRADVDQVDLVDGRDRVVTEGADRAVDVLGLVLRGRAGGDVGDELARVELPLLA